jgi:hypothetical protein
MEINGLPAIVTGGASGLGEATVRAFHAAGANLVIADLNASAGENLADELGARAAFHRTDVAVEADARGCVELARGLARLRNPSALDRTNPLYTRHPEAWLESQVRAGIRTIDATLRAAPVYEQAPQLAGGSRGIIDLLAVDDQGRLAVIEIKASPDIHLPLQALDYWMHVKWHLERGEFDANGYFPGVPLRRDPPRILLVAPALEFHPSNESIVRYFSSDIQMERIGVGLEWRQALRVMFRYR